jgi:hypothetical protein
MADVYDYRRERESARARVTEKIGLKKPAGWYSRDASMTSGRALITPIDLLTARACMVSTDRVVCSCRSFGPVINN